GEVTAVRPDRAPAAYRTRVLEVLRWIRKPRLVVRVAAAGGAMPAVAVGYGQQICQHFDGPIDPLLSRIGSGCRSQVLPHPPLFTGQWLRCPGFPQQPHSRLFGSTVGLTGIAGHAA